LISVLETIGLELVDVLRSELVRLGELWARLLLWLVGVNGRALGSLPVPLVLWIILLSIVATHLLFSVSARQGMQRPLGRIR
jgi:hypothetical protein